MADKVKIDVLETNNVDNFEGPTERLLTSDIVDHNDTISQIGATDLKSAIDKLSQGAGGGASPGLNYGRSGNTPSGQYLSNMSVPSNVVGIPVGMINPRIKKIAVRNQNINTFDISVEEHDGTTFTTIVTKSITAARGNDFIVDLPITTGKELAVKVSSGSAKNPKVQLILKGTV